MGRIKSPAVRKGVNKGLNLLRSRRIRRAVFAWALPVGLSLLILFGVHSAVKADPSPSTTQLQDYLAAGNSLDPFSQEADGYEQVFYRYNNQTVQLSSAPYNHVYAISSGQYIVWEGIVGVFSQIFLYDVLSGNMVQLTSAGTNTEPSVFNKTVVWRHWDGNTWDVYYYDGFGVRQITDSAHPCVRPSTNGVKIIYAEQIDTDLWRAQSYDIVTGQTDTIREGDTVTTAYPHFSGNTVVTDFRQY